jgi:hypothetical protein
MSIGLKRVPVTIQAGQSLSTAALLGDYTLAGLYFPAGWTAAGISYQISFDDGASYVELNDSTGAPVDLPPATAASTYYAIDVRDKTLSGVTNLKLRSGTLAAPVNQTNAVTVYVVGRRIYPGPD